MPKNMNFLPEDYLEKRVQRRTNLVCLTLFVLVMAGVAAAFMVTDRQRAEVREQQLVVRQQTEEAALRIEQLETLQERKKQMIRKAQVTSVLIEHLPRSVILAELINNMPATLSLLELDMDTRVISTPSASRTALDRARESAQQEAAAAEPMVRPTEVSFKLMGVAPTDVQVAQFMTALGRSPLFRDVTLIFSEQVVMEQQELRRFRIELMLNQDIETRTLSPKRVRRGLEHNPMADVVEFDPNRLDAEPVSVE